MSNTRKNISIIFLIVIMLTLMSIKARNLQGTSLTHKQAKALMKKYLPVVYIHSSEQYFPAAIEWFNLDWSTTTMQDVNAVITSNYKGPSSYQSNAPIYASFLQNSDGSSRLIFFFLFGYNGCGPQFEASAYVANGNISINKTESVCPAEVHWSDLEGIEIYFKADLSVNNLVYNYHQMKTFFSPSQVAWEGTNPVVYIANGSHATYINAGNQNYYNAWSDTETSYNTYGTLIDYTNNSGNRWLSSNPRLLKFNGNPSKNISTDEMNFAFKYYGRLGQQMQNESNNQITNDCNEVAILIKNYSTSTFNQIKSAENSMTDFFQSESVAPYSLGHPNRIW